MHDLVVSAGMLTCRAFSAFGLANLFGEMCATSDGEYRIGMGFWIVIGLLLFGIVMGRKRRG